LALGGSVYKTSIRNLKLIVVTEQEPLQQLLKQRLRVIGSISSINNEQYVSSGWKDVELSDLGVQQSKELTEQTKDMNFDVVFCSDLKRAHDSAKISWEGVYEIIPDAWLSGIPTPTRASTRSLEK
jgi:hypothetical protein